MDKAKPNMAHIICKTLGAVFNGFYVKVKDLPKYTGCKCDWNLKPYSSYNPEDEVYIYSIDTYHG